jgi:hypothetical protein
MKDKIILWLVIIAMIFCGSFSVANIYGVANDVYPNYHFFLKVAIATIVSFTMCVVPIIAPNVAKDDKVREFVNPAHVENVFTWLLIFAEVFFFVTSCVNGKISLQSCLFASVLSIITSFSLTYLGRFGLKKYLHTQDISIELEQAKNEVIVLQERLAEVQNLNLAKDGQISQVQNELSEVQKKLIEVQEMNYIAFKLSLVEEQSSSEVQKLNLEKEQSSNEVQNLKNEVQKLNGQVQNLNLEKSQSSEQVQALKSQVQNLNLEKSNLNLKIQRLEKFEVGLNSITRKVFTLRAGVPAYLEFSEKEGLKCVKVATREVENYSRLNEMFNL